MANTFKALALANDLADKLKLRLTQAVVQSFDTDGNPLITIGTIATTNACAVVKVMPISTPLVTDIFGNAGNQYTPHRIQIVTEAFTSGTGLGVYLGVALLPLMGELLSRRTRVEWYQDTNGTAPTIADAVAAKLVKTLEPSLYYPTIANQ